MNLRPLLSQFSRLILSSSSGGGITRVSLLLKPNYLISNSIIIQKNQVQSSYLHTKYSHSQQQSSSSQQSSSAHDDSHEDENELRKTDEIIEKVNQKIKDKSHGRLFAVVHVAGKQFKITTNDVIMIQEFWPPNIGDRIRLEKVLLAGGSDFTLIGRPLLPRDLIRIEATVIEKTLSYTKLRFILKKRKNFRRLKFGKSEYTMVRINSIEFDGLVDDSKDVEGLRPHHIF